MASSRKGGPESTPVAPAAIAGTGADRSLAETTGLIDLVSACLESHLPAAGRLVVGYSGGLDSSVLLHLLAELRARRGFSLAAVHVHHGLSPQADDWARHCARVCGDIEVPLQVARVEVRKRGEGLEAAARAARYAVFADLDADAVALAHHRDDQAETVLAQLLRGGGAKGLAAMPVCRRLAAGPLLLRPLLQAPRARIAAWARARRLLWVEDESNLHTHLARNLLRHQVLPLLETRFAAPGVALARAAERFAETAELLDDLADLDANVALGADGLSLAALAKLSPARARNLLRRRLELAGAELHAESLREGLRQLLEARPDARLAVDFGTVSLRRHRGLARIVANQPVDLPSPALWPWRGEALLDLGDAGGLRFTPARGAGVRLEPGPVTVRLRRGGERLRTAPDRPRRPLKDLLREAGIPPWRRQCLPLVYVGERLAWVAGIGADAEFLAAGGQPGWLISPWSPA